MDSAQHRSTTNLLLEDDRVGLRPLAVSDVEAHLAGCDNVIIERLSGGEPSRSQTEVWLETNACAWATGGDVVDQSKTSTPASSADVWGSSGAWTTSAQGRST
jgi:hypothetical protein